MWLRRNRNWLASLFAGLVVLGVPSTALANSNIQTKICTSFAGPTITAPTPSTETENASVTVTGVGEPGMAVSILRGGVVAGTTTAVIDGTYGIEIGLDEGDNTLMGREVNECGTVESSSPVSIYRTVESSSRGSVSSESPELNVDDETAAGPPASPVMQLPMTPLVDTPGFVKPTIATPTPGVTFNTTQVWVGGQAQPGSAVTIYLNDHSAAYGIATEKGVYGALLSLSRGENTVQVRSVLDNGVATSDSIGVMFEQDETLTTPVTESAIGTSVATQVTLVVIAGATVGGVAFWSIPELRHLVRLGRFK